MVLGPCGTSPTTSVSLALIYRKREVWLVKGKIDGRSYYLMTKASPYPFGIGEPFYLSATFPDVPVKLRWRPEASFDDLRAFATDAMQLGGSADVRAVSVSEKLSGSWSVVGCRGREDGTRQTSSSTPAVPTPDLAAQNMIAWFGLPGVTPGAVVVTGGSPSGQNAPEPIPDQAPRRVAPPPVVPIVPVQAENVSGTEPSNQPDRLTSTDSPKTAVKRETRKLRYADWFLASGCNWDRPAGPDGTARSLYRRELLDYAPDALELLLFIWEEPGCPRPKATKRVSVQNYWSIPTPGNVPAVSLPSRFSCRLDKLVLREVNSEKLYGVRRAFVGATFLYREGSGSTVDHTGDPLPLKESVYRYASDVLVEIEHEGKPYVLFSSNIVGSPAHIEGVRALSEFRDLKFSAPDELPTVTARNADNFAFDPSTQWPITRDGMPLHLRDRTWVPARCRRAAI